MSRLYIRLQTSFYSHRKTMRLWSKLGNDAFWLPPRLWAYCAENQPDGDLSQYQPEELSMLVAYKGDAQAMLVALKDCGFVTSDGHIHDWSEHNGYHSKYSARAKKAADARWGKKEKNQKKEQSTDKERGKWKGEQASVSIACSITPSLSTSEKRVLGGGTPEIMGETRQSNNPKKFIPPNTDEVRLFCDKSGISEQDADWFWHKCEGNGWTNGGKPIKSWQHTLTSWKLANYLPSQKTQPNGHPQHNTKSILEQDIEKSHRRIMRDAEKNPLPNIPITGKFIRPTDL